MQIIINNEFLTGAEIATGIAYVMKEIEHMESTAGYSGDIWINGECQGEWVG